VESLAVARLTSGAAQQVVNLVAFLFELALCLLDFPDRIVIGPGLLDIRLLTGELDSVLEVRRGRMVGTCLGLCLGSRLLLDAVSRLS
jgi:hypothetical protein